MKPIVCNFLLVSLLLECLSTSAQAGKPRTMVPSESDRWRNYRVCSRNRCGHGVLISSASWFPGDFTL
jgi:hypothetical protein